MIRFNYERDNKLADAMYRALTPLAQSHSKNEMLIGLLILVCDLVEAANDPRAAAEALCEAMRTNFLSKEASPPH